MDPSFPELLAPGIRGFLGLHAVQCFVVGTVNVHQYDIFVEMDIISCFLSFLVVVPLFLAAGCRLVEFAFYTRLVLGCVQVWSSAEGTAYIVQHSLGVHFSSRSELARPIASRDYLKIILG